MLVAFLAAAPTAFVKQCAKEADRVAFREKYNIGGYGGNYNSGFGTNTYDAFKNDNFIFRHQNINWLGVDHKGSKRLENDVQVSIESNFVLDTTEIPSTIRVMSAIPESSEDFTNIFARSPSTSALNDANKAAKALRELKIDGDVVGPNNAPIAIDSIKNSESQIVIIVGHNENGNLRLNDGSSIPLSELGGFVKKRVKTVFLSAANQNYL